MISLYVFAPDREQFRKPGMNKSNCCCVGTFESCFNFRINYEIITSDKIPPPQPISKILKS